MLCPLPLSRRKIEGPPTGYTVRLRCVRIAAALAFFNGQGQRMRMFIENTIHFIQYVFLTCPICAQASLSVQVPKSNGSHNSISHYGKFKG